MLISNEERAIKQRKKSDPDKKLKMMVDLDALEAMFDNFIENDR